VGTDNPVDAHAVRSALIDGRPAQLCDAGLYGAVSTVGRNAKLGSRARASVNDRAAASLRHSGELVFETQKRPAQARVHDGGEINHGEVDQGARKLQASGIERAVERAVTRDRAAHQRLDLLVLSYIRPDERRFAAGLDDQAGHLLTAIFRRPARTTDAPRRPNPSAVARPMPEVPPTTSATLPSNEITSPSEDRQLARNCTKPTGSGEGRAIALKPSGADADKRINDNSGDVRTRRAGGHRCHSQKA
jgi:hypothetical protein